MENSIMDVRIVEGVAPDCKCTRLGTTSSGHRENYRFKLPKPLELPPLVHYEVQYKEVILYHLVTSKLSGAPLDIEHQRANDGAPLIVLNTAKTTFIIKHSDYVDLCDEARNRIF